jgi:predicted ATPase/DNA-binding CsgD family transcriptional regulator
MIRAIETLTRREEDILRLICQGLSDQQIAERLVLSLGTVKWYNKHIYGKLGVSNRTQASIEARTRGLFNDQTTPTIPTTATHNLPAQLTVFIGRKHELAEMKRLLGIGRLLTLTGVGGIGKTRLAVEFARTQVEAFANGVYFVPLAPLIAPESILWTIAEAIQFQIQQHKPPQSQLLDYLRRKSMLLVLDNYEHLLDNAALVTAILQAAPDVRIIATSRERLNLYGEVVYTLGGLQLPETAQADNLLENDAVALFIDCARRAEPTLHIDENILEEIARICRVVGGMPLGIELAAPWIRVLPLHDIAAEIERGLDILESKSSESVYQSQPGIRAVFERSWNLLTAQERELLRRISVFRGGCTRAAAQVVTGANLWTLQALVDKSLLRFNPENERYEIHELLRQYAAHKLDTEGKTGAARDAHLQYFADFIAGCEGDLKGARQHETALSIELDFENVRAAWDWALRQCMSEPIHRMVESLLWLGEVRSRQQDINALFEMALAACEGDAEWQSLRARIEARRCMLLPYHDDAQVVAEKAAWCLSVAKQQGDPAETAFCTMLMSYLVNRIGERDSARSVAYGFDSLAQFQKLNDPFYTAFALMCIVFAYIHMGERQLAMQYAHECLALRREIGDQNGIARILLLIGAHAFSIAAYDEAERINQEIKGIWEALGCRSFVSFVNVNLAYLAIFKGDLESARTLTDDALRVAHDVSMDEFSGYALAMSGVIASLEERYAEAYAMLCEAQHRASGTAAIEAVEWGIPMAACGLGDYARAKRANHRALQYASRLDAPARLLWHLSATAIIQAREGCTQRAAELLALSFQHPMSATAWLYRWPMLTRLRGELENELGAETFAAAWERGKDLDVEATVDTLLAEWA